ncbi:hypothetical protein NOS3756_49570 [Nostoc sp. NIES-3756]|uniref:hypothetical protein n=1 Tax=Nostoc sp. NIES-3756 TaxID=1751286 RepID=UPI000720D6F9|nr:hypothetical protein [Nostoc sp. NIES-3756]BAT55960.1 hypothetical protein NOS3756_49570 [Nostoc sp. NIES-3756]
MAAVRKSSISTSGSWFRRGSSPSLRKRRTSPGVAVRNDSTSAESSKAPKRQGRFMKNVSSPVNTSIKGSVAPTSNIKVQPNSRPKNIQSSSAAVSVVPTAKALPAWLLQLHSIHRYSSIAAFLLVAATLGVYGWTVYTQELWGQNYSRLQKLQRDERQITTTNATLTHKMAEEAESQAAGLVSPTPAKTIFLSPVPHKPDVVIPSPTPSSQTQSLNSPKLGY